MEGVMHLLANGGMLPHYQPAEGEQGISPRRKGVKQGALIMLIGAVLVPLLGVFTSFAPGRIDVAFEFFTALAAILCFVGGPLRMLYAALFEEGAPTRRLVAPSSYAPPSIPAPLGMPARLSALPAPAVNPASSWRPRPETGEILQPPSVTDSTTRLLQKPEPEGD